jgi:hypothetical protein
MNNLILLLAQETQPINYDLTPGGWIIMLLSVGFVTGLMGWCIWRVTRESSPAKLHTPQDIDTRDLNEN